MCFPDGRAPRDLGPDLPRAAVLDGADLEAPWTSITRVLDATLGTGTALSAETMAALTDVLAPRFSVTPSLSADSPQSRAWCAAPGARGL